MCLCGYSYRGKKCRSLMKKYPMLKDKVWHYPVHPAWHEQIDKAILTERKK